MSLTKIRKSNIESNVQLPHTNAAFDTANSSGVYANAAFTAANNAAAGSVDAYARDTANSASSYANGAFTAANNAVDTWVRDASNSASSYANSAYAEANARATITYVDNAVANLVNSAPSTLDTLNELATALNNDPDFATTIATNIGIIGNYSNAAYVQANTANTTAQAAYDAANNAVDTWVRDASNSASSYANSGYSQANTANTTAQAAYDAANNATDSWVRDASNSASSYANSSFVHANAAYDYANTLISGGSFALSVVHDSFTADGTSNTFTLSTTPIDENYTLITLDGVVQHKSAYNIVSSNIVFSGIPDVNTFIDVMIFSSANASYQEAYDHANAAYDAANNATDSWVRDAANSASSYANSAYSEANNKLSLSGGTLTGNLVVGGNVMPTTDNTYYLGSETARWHSLYVGDGSIYIGDVVLSNDANRLAVTDGDGNKVTISSNNIVLGDFVLSSSGAITGDVIITGNLRVTGTTADLEVSGLVVDDNIIDINEATLGAPTLNSGLRVKRGDENAVLLRWNETNDRWEYTNDGTNYSNIASAAAETYANAAFNAANTATIGFATETYVSNAVANLVNSAPETLNTLNELAVALNNDPSFATTIATSIGIIGSYANSAYLQANTPSDVANSASVYANAAFDAANNAVDTWVRDAANSASSYANSSYSLANTANTLAQAAFDAANTGGAGTDDYARDTANSASVYANAAFAVANTGGSSSNSFYVNIVHDSFVASGSQDTFTLSTTPINENYTLVTINGIVQHKNAYSVSSANLVLSESPAANSEIDVVSYTRLGAGAFNLSIVLDTFNGDGTTNTFSLSTSPVNENYTSVVIDGVAQLKTSYNVSGSNLIFAESPDSGANIDVTIYTSVATEENIKVDLAYDHANAAYEQANTGGGGASAARAMTMAILFG